MHENKEAIFLSFSLSPPPSRCFFLVERIYRHPHQNTYKWICRPSAGRSSWSFVGNRWADASRWAGVSTCKQVVVWNTSERKISENQRQTEQELTDAAGIRRRQINLHSPTLSTPSSSSLPANIRVHVPDWGQNSDLDSSKNFHLIRAFVCVCVIIE